MIPVNIKRKMIAFMNLDSIEIQTCTYVKLCKMKY